MRAPHLLSLLLMTSACLFADGPNDRTVTDPKSLTSPPNAQAKPVNVDDFFYTTRIFSASWSPDGKQIAYAGNASGRFNIWTMNADGSGAKQLTQSDERQAAPVWSPDGKAILFEQDKGGDEMYDLWIVPASGGTPVNLTSTPENRENSAQFSHDGKSIAFDSKSKQSPITDIGVMAQGDKATRLLTHEKDPQHSWSIAFWSPDDKYIYAVRGKVTTDDSDIYRIDVASGNAENLTQHSGKVINTPGGISPDGKWLLFSSNEKGGFSNVGLLDTDSKTKKWITDTQWEANASDWSPKGNKFAYRLNADGRTSFYISDPNSGTGKKLPLPDGVNSDIASPHSFSPDGSKLIVMHQDSTRPADLWVIDVASGKASQLTHSARPSMAQAALPKSQIVHYKTFDGKIISALLWMPFNMKRDGSNPAIVYPHGGPTGQTTDTFSPTPIALATRGYIVIAPNPRGSTGYGIDFQMANHQDLGGGDLKDEIAGVDWLKQTGYVDGKKIGITGGSYGGFMTLMAIGKAPEVWGAAVELFGIIDWKTMLQHSDPGLQEYEKGLLGDPDKDAGVYEATSPIKYIRNEKAPLLILQGERDIRVPAEEARQVEQILKQEGKTVDAHYYPDEGHGWYKREDQIDSLNRTIAWFDKYLKGGGTATAGGR